MLWKDMMDPADVGFERFSLLRHLECLLADHPPGRFGRVRMLDADAPDGSLLQAVPRSTQVVLGNALPADLAGEARGPVFLPWESPFPPGSFHLVLAGASVALRQGPSREATLRGLLEMTRGVLVLALPPSGATAEVALSAYHEFLRGRLGGDHPETARVARTCGAEPVGPDDVEAILSGRRCHVQYLPALDPVGAFSLRVLHQLFRTQVDSDRLSQLVDRLHNLTLLEGGATLSPLYHDLCLVFPGRRSLPRAVARRLSGERPGCVRPGKDELDILQVVLQLDELDRRRALVPGEEPGPARRAPADLGRLDDRLDMLLRVQEHILEESARHPDTEQVRAELQRELEQLQREVEGRLDREGETLRQVSARLDEVHEAVREVETSGRTAARTGEEAARTRRDEERQERRGLESSVSRLQVSLEGLGKVLEDRAAVLASRLEESEAGWRKRLQHLEARQEGALEKLLAQVPEAPDLEGAEARLGARVRQEAGWAVEESRRQGTRLEEEIGRVREQSGTEARDLRETLEQVGDRLDRLEKLGERGLARTEDVVTGLRGAEERLDDTLRDLVGSFEDASGQVAGRLGALHAQGQQGHLELVRLLQELRGEEGRRAAVVERALTALNTRLGEDHGRTVGLLESLRSGFTQERRELVERFEETGAELGRAQARLAATLEAAALERTRLATAAQGRLAEARADLTGRVEVLTEGLAEELGGLRHGLELRSDRLDGALADLRVRADRRHDDARGALRRGLEEFGGALAEDREAAEKRQGALVGALAEAREAAEAWREALEGVLSDLGERGGEEAARLREELERRSGELAGWIEEARGQLAEQAARREEAAAERHLALTEVQERLAEGQRELRQERPADDLAGLEARLRSLLEPLTEGLARSLELQESLRRDVEELASRPAPVAEGVSREVAEEDEETLPGRTHEHSRELAAALGEERDRVDTLRRDLERLESRERALAGEVSEVTVRNRQLEEENRGMHERNQALADENRSSRERAQDLERRLRDLEGELHGVGESHQLLLERVELFQELVSKHPVLRAYIRAKGAELLESPVAAARDAEGGE